MGLVGALLRLVPIIKPIVDPNSKEIGRERAVRILERYPGECGTRTRGARASRRGVRAIAEADV